MYENPITKICQDIRTQIVQRDEQMILEAIQKQGIFVDKEELIKALNYDRNQYSKGYKDGVSEVLDSIRAEIEQVSFTHYFEYGEYCGEDTKQKCIVNFDAVMQIIDKYKGGSEE